MSANEDLLDKIKAVEEQLKQQQKYLDALELLQGNIEAEAAFVKGAVERVIAAYNKEFGSDVFEMQHSTQTIIDNLNADTSLISGAIAESLQAVKQEFELG